MRTQTVSGETTDGSRRAMSLEEKKIIIASSLGTVFEWYDFFLYGSLAVTIGAKFFGQFDETTRNVFALLAFAAGFVVRPLGALVFGHFGDLIGRKYTFLATITIMGLSTFLVGILPTSESIGFAAPVILISLRLLQGLALGGEYGGAATYVAEHAPQGRRGYYTSWIQTTATGGLFLSLLVILGTQAAMSTASFDRYGWRIPFILSIVLLAVSVWIRTQLHESPAFQKMKDEGTRSKAPISEAFGRWSNLKWVLVALFGVSAGEAVVWYTGQFYVLFFMTSVLKVGGFTANLLVMVSLIIGFMGFVFFGWLSDRIGRKPIMVTGCLVAALTFFPAFRYLAEVANPALYHSQSTVNVVVAADPADCSFQFNPTGLSKFTKSCDLAKAALARASVTYVQEDAAAGTNASVRIGSATLNPKNATFGADLAAALSENGYPAAANPSVVQVSSFADLFSGQALKIIGTLCFLLLLVTMVYGPMAAALVELFPTRIRYTAMSLPYHIGNGWFGGLLPATIFAMNAQTGSIYFGLWYPVVIAGLTGIIGLLFLPETKNRDIEQEDFD